MRLTRVVACILCAAVALVIGPAGCSTGPKQDPAALEGVRWVVVEMADETGAIAPAVSGADVTAEFDGEKVGGSGGVNSYSAPYEVSGSDKLEIGVAAATLMAGPENLMAQETAYFANLEKAQRYRVSSDSLELLDAAGGVLVKYRADEPITLQGGTWYCTGYNNGNQAVVSLVAGSVITAEFSDTGELSGSAGVNTYNTTYTTTGAAQMSIADGIATTLMAGPQELMDQETAYLAALPKVGFYRIDGDSLVLRESADGPMIATYSSNKP